MEKNINKLSTLSKKLSDLSQKIEEPVYKINKAVGTGVLALAPFMLNKIKKEEIKLKTEFEQNQKKIEELKNELSKIKKELGITESIKNPRKKSSNILIKESFNPNPKIPTGPRIPIEIILAFNLVATPYMIMKKRNDKTNEEILKQKETIQQLEKEKQDLLEKLNKNKLKPTNLAYQFFSSPKNLAIGGVAGLTGIMGLILLKKYLEKRKKEQNNKKI